MDLKLRLHSPWKSKDHEKHRLFTKSTILEVGNLFIISNWGCYYFNSRLDFQGIFWVGNIMTSPNFNHRITNPRFCGSSIVQVVRTMPTMLYVFKQLQFRSGNLVEEGGNVGSCCRKEQKRMR